MASNSVKRLISLDVLVLGTVLGIVVTVATYSFLSQPPTPDRMEEILAPWTEPQAESRSAEPDADVRITTLENELATALARIDQLYADREHAWEQTSAWVDSILDTMAPQSTLHTELLQNFRAKLEIRKKAESGKMLAGLDDAMFLMFATALAGDAAVQELCNSVRDDDANMAFRVESLQSLGYLPSESSLELLLNPPPDVAAAANYNPSDDGNIGRYALMAEFLPTESIARFEPELYAMAANRLNENSSDGDAWNLMAVLAFEHNDKEASKLLSDPRTLRYFGEDVLQVAWWSGTAESKAYIERIAASHPTPELRQRAAEILAAWP